MPKSNDLPEKTAKQEGELLAEKATVILRRNIGRRPELLEGQPVELHKYEADDLVRRGLADYPTD